MGSVQRDLAVTAGSCGAFGQSAVRRLEDSARDTGNGGRDDKAAQRAGAGSDAHRQRAEASSAGFDWQARDDEAAQRHRAGAGSDAQRQRAEASSAGFDWQARDDEAAQRHRAGAGGDVAHEQEGSGSEEDAGDPAHDQRESGEQTLATLLQTGKPVGTVRDGVLRLCMFEVQGEILSNFC